MDEYVAILDSIRAKPNDAAHWLLLAGWLADNGHDDQAAAVRVFFPVMRENLSLGATLEQTIAIVRLDSVPLGRRARLMEEQADSHAGPVQIELS
jgi:uncharacterized protein (TIGR02996 family)